MEKVFVHPECPFSENTFNLLTDFYEDPRSDFYRTHKQVFFKYVENPLKYILSQVEYLLPDFIKNYINFRIDQFGSLLLFQGVPSISYSVALGLGDINSLDYGQFMLNIEPEKVTFGLYSKIKSLKNIINNYSSQCRSDSWKTLLELYKLPHQTFCELNRHVHSYNYVIEDSRFGKSENSLSVFSLLEEIFCWQEIPKNLLITPKVNNIKVAVSLESSEVLGYSAKQLIAKIAQTFKKIFPLFLLFNLYENDLSVLVNEYFLLYKKEFNQAYHFEEISELTGFQTSEINRWIRTINRKQQAIIQGPPGTGKTFLAQKLAQYLIGGGDGFSDIIQFHPAYTYEDFIQGIRPQSQDGGLTYPLVPGRFLEFCKQAEAREDTCVLIIDEINRANLSQVFGELMYLLDDRDRTVKLASGQQFTIPKNVCIIGTMNTADRSIALVDNALRRRFAFIPLSPNYKVLRHYHKTWQTGFPIARLNRLIGILKDINVAINNKHYELGISFFLTKTLSENIQDIWEMEIEPYLEEYFFDNLEKMDEFLWENIKNKLGY
ncbi:MULTISPECIES: AAA family ATPase [unclassified Microcoleus]|uniref:AAA family ATPase n=1 Tax=unclassified Microcoleus TaxID=2642155 RepID=UPI002FCEF07E